MNDNYTNTLIYDAMKENGAKQEDARAAATEAARSNPHSDMDSSFSNTEAETSKEFEKAMQAYRDSSSKNTNKILVAMGIATTMICISIWFFF